MEIFKIDKHETIIASNANQSDITIQEENRSTKQSK